MGIIELTYCGFEMIKMKHLLVYKIMNEFI